jgi:uncharacterized protein
MAEETYQLLLTKIEPHFEDINNCHEFMHTKRVLKLALKLGELEKADLEIIKTAALLHDIARQKQDESKGKICHAEEGANMAEEILKEINYPKEKIEQVKHCIKTHRYRNNNIPETIEAKIIYDADKLDAIGAIGIARAISFSGHIGACVHHSDKQLLLNSEGYSKYDCAYREYLVKLSKIKDKMLTNGGKKMAEERHTFMEIFFNRINNEIEGKL